MSILRSISAWRHERVIRSQVVSHANRNEQLRKVLLGHKVPLGAPRAIDLHFWTNGKEAADRLADALRVRGYDIRVEQPAASEESGLWNVEASVNQTPSLTLSDSFTEDIVRLAVQAGGNYDGWGTAIDPAPQSPE